MIKQECIGIPDMILLLMNFFVSKKIKIKAEIVLSPGGAYFVTLKNSQRNVTFGISYIRFALNLVWVVFCCRRGLLSTFYSSNVVI